jgi:hypothetical protein
MPVHDPIRWCWDCKLPKRRDSFRSMGHKKGTRNVCADCAKKIQEEREKRKCK